MSGHERITTMRLVVIILFITLVKANPQAPLHQQEQENNHLNPINDAAAKEEAAKLQNKRTLFGATHYLPKHVGIHPLGFKYILGYGPISGYYPYAKPLSIWKPVLHTTGWKPIVHAANVPIFRQKPHVHIHPVQPVHPVLPVQPVQPVVPVHTPEPAVVPVEKHVPEPVVPVVKPLIHLQPPVYPFYKPLFNPLIPQPNIIQPPVHFHQHLIPQPPVVPQLVPQPHVVQPVQHPVFHQVQQVQPFLPPPPVVQHLIPQPHLHPVQQLIPQPHLHSVQPLIPQQHLHPVQPHVHSIQPHLHPVQPHVHPVQPLIPQPHLHPVQPVQPLIPQPQFVHHVLPQPPPAVPVAPAVPQLPPPLYHILKSFPQIPIFKHITPLYPVNPPPAVAHPVPELPRPIVPSDGGVSVQIPQHLPEHPNFPPPQFPFHPEAGSGHEVHHQPQPDFQTEVHGQADNPFLIPQPQPQGPVHPHPQTPLYLPPHPVFRPGVANPVGPIEPTNSVHTEFSATFPKHPLVPGLQHPSITLEPPYGPAGIGLNINKH